MADPKADWQDFTWFVGDYVPRQTIPILKRFASHIEIRTRLSVGLRAGDKKADIVDKVVAAFRALKARNDLVSYTAIRTLCENEGYHVAKPGHSHHHVPQPTFGGVASSAMNGRPNGYSVPTASASSYRPAAAAAGPGPSRNGWQSQNTTTAYASRAPTLMDWKPNPMWKPIRALSNMEMLPDIGPSEGSHTRKERKIHITLPPDVIEKLNQTKANPQSHPQYSVRIFCTSNDWYKAPNTPYSPANALVTNKQMPIDYPNNPDVYVDDYPINFKERGLRGKPGSSPPFDLDKSSKGLQRVAGRMTSVTMGHTGPTTGKKKDISKKFFFQVVYCEITSSEQLQARIDRMVPATAADSLNLLRKKQDDDDDIVFGQSHMSLKDPLSYMRMERPIRSTKCSHLQCFEAKWWISQNIKHPQWLCPLCNRELRFDELIVDGFTLDILDVVPEKYDEVVIEADNAWHTEDGSYGSAAWLAIARNEKPTKKEPSPEKQEQKPDAFRLSTSPDPKGKRKAIEILSSDDEDEQPLAKTTTAPSDGHLRPLQLAPLARPARAESSLSAAPETRAPSAQPPPPKPKNTVIDLTADSDDEAETGEADDDAVARFDRSNDQRYPGAGSLSLPPPRPFGISGETSSVRSPSFNSQTNAGFPSNSGLDAGGRSFSNGSNHANGSGYGNDHGNGNGNGEGDARARGDNRFPSSYTHNDPHQYRPNTTSAPSYSSGPSRQTFGAGPPGPPEAVDSRDQYRSHRVDSWRSQSNSNNDPQARRRYDNDNETDSEDGYGF